MKLQCPCGSIISDSTDGLPCKAHLIPDQDWVPLCISLEKVVADAVSRRMELENAFMQIHLLLASRLVYQCQDCGRLFVDDNQHNSHIYTPSSDGTCKEILRSRPENP